MAFFNSFMDDPIQSGQNPDPYEIKLDGGKVKLRVSEDHRGNKIPLETIQAKLLEMDIEYVDEKLLEIYEKARNEFENLPLVVRYKYQYTFDVTPDEQKTFITVLPPTSGFLPITSADIEARMREYGIKEGFLYDKMQELIDQRVFKKPFLVAQGEPAIDGKDGFLEIVPVKDSSFKLESKQLDLRQLYLLKDVNKDETILRITPSTKGKNGFTVLGKVIRAKSGRKFRLLPGKNTRYSADRTEIVATLDGFAIISGNQVSVEKMHAVKNIDSSSGSIRYDGILYVDGNIENGVTVDATAGIEVTGAVGAATLRTRGHIKVHNGIFGSTLKAGWSVQSLFFQEANIEAGESVIANQYIRSSNVRVGKYVHVTDPDGFIVGGNITASNFINVPIVGSKKADVSTVLELEPEPGFKLRFNELEKKLRDNLFSFEKVKKNMIIMQAAKEKRGVLPPEHEQTFEKMVPEMTQLRDSMVEDMKFWKEGVAFNKIARDTGGGLIFVPATVYPGTEIRINKRNVRVDQAMNKMGFQLAGGRIQFKDFQKTFDQYGHLFDSPHYAWIYLRTAEEMKGAEAKPQPKPAAAQKPQQTAQGAQAKPTTASSGNAQPGNAQQPKPAPKPTSTAAPSAPTTDAKTPTAQTNFANVMAKSATHPNKPAVPGAKPPSPNAPRPAPNLKQN